MKIALFLLVALTTATGFSNSEDLTEADKQRVELQACRDKCPEEENKGGWVCHGEGLKGEASRCSFNCKNKVYENGQLKETECKRGGYPYCLENECPAEEKEYNPRGGWCVKGMTDRSFLTICAAKCSSGLYNNDAPYAPC